MRNPAQGTTVPKCRAGGCFAGEVGLAPGKLAQTSQGRITGRVLDSRDRSFGPFCVNFNLDASRLRMWDKGFGVAVQQEGRHYYAKENKTHNRVECFVASALRCPDCNGEYRTQPSWSVKYGR